jgi:hypothetical protein
MTSRVISFRIDTDSPAGKIFEMWEQKGYEARQIVESALLLSEGYEPPISSTVSQNALDALTEAVARLENIAEQIQQNGGVVSVQHQQALDEALSPEFIQGMKSVVRPGFNKRPDAGENKE